MVLEDSSVHVIIGFSGSTVWDWLQLAKAITPVGLLALN